MNTNPTQPTWGQPVTDAAGVTAKSCRITSTIEGVTRIYTVIARYSLQDLTKRGYKGEIDQAIEEAVNAVAEVFPQLGQMAFCLDPDKPQEVIVTSHPVYAAKKLAEIKDEALKGHITKISNQFLYIFEKHKNPVTLEIKEETLQEPYIKFVPVESHKGKEEENP